ncbi:cytidine deaminase [Pleomorphochaeta sp. DL1XJH-081]|jgi:cytidine deaminase|uniref:cytidine deaminase n=1 Tax=Pleomorphochaeta sp. DL1XJH-081 TaxID=3409690 RepID=UPI003BB5D77C
MIKAILFDMDGVLIDSEEYISEAAIAYFASIGVTVKAEDFIPFVGAGEDRYIGGVAEKYGIKLDIEQAKLDTYDIYEQLIMGKESALVGVVRFLTNAHEAGMLMAVATSADRRKMEINLEVMGLDPKWFKVLVNGKDLERKKPFPDIYIKAANDMGVENGECIVFEDATNGVQAAKAAGSLCGGITTSFSEEQLRAVGADFIIGGLDDFEDFSSISEFNRLLLRFKAREIASQVRLNAYTPYSHFQVGAAVVSASTGSVYRGCNVENSSYGATICAERGAMMEAVASEGDFRIDMVVVVSDDDPPAPPCALCLQVMAEFAKSDTEVFLYDTEGKGRQFRFDELLPHPFIFPTQRHRHS